MYFFPMTSIMPGDFIISNIAFENGVPVNPEEIYTGQPIKVAVRTSPGKDAFVPTASTKHRDPALQEGIMEALSGDLPGWRLYAAMLNGDGIRFQFANAATRMQEEMKLRNKCKEAKFDIFSMCSRGSGLQFVYDERTEHDRKLRFLTIKTSMLGPAIPERKLQLLSNYSRDGRTEVIITETL